MQTGHAPFGDWGLVLDPPMTGWSGPTFSSTTSKRRSDPAGGRETCTPAQVAITRRVVSSRLHAFGFGDEEVADLASDAVSWVKAGSAPGQPSG
jgi:hypothetical protein